MPLNVKHSISIRLCINSAKDCSLKFISQAFPKHGDDSSGVEKFDISISSIPGSGCLGLHGSRHFTREVLGVSDSSN